MDTIGLAARLAFSIVVIVVLTACGTPELSRIDAAKILESSDDEVLNKVRTKIQMHENGFDLGARLGYWILSYNDKQLSSKISTEVRDVSHHPDRFTPVQPVAISIEVTGISGDPKDSQKVVDFNWNYSNLKSLTKRLAIKGGHGQALFQLYDDGWRIARVIALIPNNDPYPLSPQESAAMLADLTAEGERKAAEQKAAVEAEQAFKRRVVLARNGTKIISEHYLETKSATWGNTTVTIMVSDSGVRIQETINRLKETNTTDILFASLPRNTSTLANLNGSHFWIGRRLVSVGVDIDTANSPAYSKTISAVNGAFDDWKKNYADVVVGCARRGKGTLGCF